MAFARGETAQFNNLKPGIIRHKGNVWAAYAGNRKLTDSKSKKEAIKRVIEAIDTQGRLFQGKRKQQTFMDERTVTVTERDGKYQVENTGIPEFALIGILECVIFEMKSARRQMPPVYQTESLVEEKAHPQERKEAAPEHDRKVAAESSPPDLRTRIGNAVKAIKGLGGEANDINRS